MLYATSEGVVLLDLKNRRIHYLVFDKRVVNFWGTEGGVGGGGGGEENILQIYQRILPTSGSRNTPKQCELASDSTIVGSPM